MGLKNAVPAIRSKLSKISAPASTGVEIRTSAEVASIAQQNKGISKNVMSLMRIVSRVVRKLSAPKIEEVPRTRTLRIQIICPT